MRRERGARKRSWINGRAHKFDFSFQAEIFVQGVLKYCSLRTGEDRIQKVLVTDWMELL